MEAAVRGSASEDLGDAEEEEAMKMYRMQCRMCGCNEWSGEFDEDGTGEFQCPECGSIQVAASDVDTRREEERDEDEGPGWA